MEGRLCAYGNLLYEFWARIAQLLDAEGVPLAAQKKNLGYIDAFNQYNKHIHTCPRCWAGLQSLFARARAGEVVHA